MNFRTPLYWLLVSDREKPREVLLRRFPVVWVFLLLQSVWGFICLDFSPRLFLNDEPFAIECMKWITTIGAYGFPNFLTAFKVANREGKPYEFDQFLASMTVGVFMSMLLGLALKIFLKVVGVETFLGLPVWN